MNDDQLARYSRHLLLPEIDTRGQEKLLAARILVVGLGGLGSPAAIYLAASGIGTLVLCDGDEVDVSNLQRQILHATSDVGRPKTASALAHLRALNPEVRVFPLARKLEGVELQREVERADAVLDCSDNFPTRFALNEACATAQRPLISGSAIRTRGQVAVFRFDKQSRPCYRCLYPETGEDRDSCSQSGVFAPLTGIIGGIQAAETLKTLLDWDETLQGRLLRVDATTMEFRTARIQPDPQCPVCAKPALSQPALEVRTGSG